LFCPNRFGLLVQRVVYSVIDLRDLTRRFAPKAFGAGAQIEGEEVRRSEINDKWIFKNGEWRMTNDEGMTASPANNE
jgi:hypothetical protein